MLKRKKWHNGWCISEVKIQDVRYERGIKRIKCNKQGTNDVFRVKMQQVRCGWNIYKLKYNK